MTGTEYRKLYKKSPDSAYNTLFENYCDYVYAIVYNKLRSVASGSDVEVDKNDMITPESLNTPDAGNAPATYYRVIDSRFGTLKELEKYAAEYLRQHRTEHV